MEKQEYGIMYHIEDHFWWYRGLHEIVEYFVRAQAATAKLPLAIFDAGCGTGRMMQRIANAGSVEGIDYSDEALLFCKQRGIDSAVQQDLNTWAPQKRYDVIISLDVLCHATIKSEETILQRFYDALTPGGLLILNLPAFNFLMRQHDRAVYTKKRFTKNPTLATLKGLGFHTVTGTYRLPWVFFIMLAKKMLDKFSSGKNAASDLKPLPNWINSLLLLANRIENRLIVAGIPMPVGGSLFIVVRKPE
jgi:2-polyprenyl-3-methyl-5-hydroxy-6-metoxy-1,4-benzoquinol methylase